ncbi:MAG: chromosome segregation protein SMC [Cytophagia bacterium]|nr:MAG: chromosome segregation protein SMC [Runella sp.]TAG18165.1 MAG: chromosome segregation protein SMC [Cytophagales bacterium]TAG37705.1 MAG: chromosome segregation protein SMC [Cytophagia bacterium]TAG52566.1 MAG: chromosome segregation protein SMC [Runella slithyformis]TAG78867.1 MAG: chromosome segregation protein SMC [Cytophagales bacterium]
MVISRIKLKNWKNFRDIDVALKDRMFVVGPNASGKSNFLDAFRFLRDIAKPGGGLQKAVIDRGGVSKIRCLAARQYPDIEIEVHLSDFGSADVLWKYAIGIKQESRGYRLPYLTYERVWKGTKLIIDRPDKEDKKDDERLTQTFLEQINANKSFREIGKFFETILYLHLVPQLLKNPYSFTGPNLFGDPFGKDFLERISKVSEKTRKAWLNKIQAALQIAVPQLNALEYVEENGRPHLEAKYEHWRPNAAKQREDQFSDGTLRLIALLWSLQEGDGVLLLEEPELSLNGAIVSKIPSLISKIQRPKKRQIILTTHSTDLLSDRGIGLDEILLLTPHAEGTSIKEAFGIPEAKVLLASGLSPAEVVQPQVKPQNVQQLTLGF